MVLISDEGFPRRVGARGSKRPCFTCERTEHRIDCSGGLRGEARADVADEFQGRGGVGMRGPVDAILEDQVLLGERFGLAVIPRRAEKDAVGAKSRQVLRTSSIEVVSRPTNPWAR